MIGVVLCGGVGSRLWPVSRDLYPKPFIKLPDGESFIQKTFRRAAALPEAEHIITVTGADIYFKVKDEFEETGLNLDSTYMLEPFGRNTAPAIVAAALHTMKHHSPDTLLLILPSDHLIEKKEVFASAIQEAMVLARSDRLTTFGIKPTRPDTGFGYIEADGNRVVRFVEKPDAETACRYVDSGNFVWNSGMFCFKAAVMVEEVGRYAPEILDAMNKCLSLAKDDRQGCIEFDAGAFSGVPAKSIDFAVMEKSERVSVVQCDIGWNDVGSWNELCGLDPVDENGNHVAHSANFVSVDTRNCNVSNRDRIVATLGVENLLIVETTDAILVADNARAQDVRLVYNRLKASGREAYKQHRTIHRPWGSFSILEHGPRFKIKKLVLKPGASISLQLHHHRSEHWIMVSGMAKVTCDDKVFFVHTNESAYIKAGCKHRVENPGKIDLVIIEVQSGDYLGEDDIERFEDVYGRDTLG